MMTHMCVDSTTRAASELGYNPILIHDTTATKALSFTGHDVDASDVEHALIASLTNFSTVMSTDEWLELECTRSNKPWHATYKK